MIEPITLTKEKIAAYCKVSQDFISKADVHFAVEGLDYIHGTLTARIETFILSRLHESQETLVFIKPQSFWDCLLRRKQMVRVRVNAKEVLKNPPELPQGQSILMYRAVDAQLDESHDYGS